MKASSKARAGLTLVELSVMAAVVVTLLAIGVPIYLDALREAARTVARRDLREMQDAIDLFRMEQGRLPTRLYEAGVGDRLDPWDQPYEYLSFETADGQREENRRKDRFLAPVNSDYDLYTVGPDGRTSVFLTSGFARDDVLRTGNGEAFMEGSIF